MESYSLLRPLIVMSFVLVQYLREQHFFHASTVIVTSASSKTALGLAMLLGREVPTVGMTSARNLQFVEKSNSFDRTATYDDDLDDVMDGACLILDFAGDDALVERLRSRARGLCRVIRTGQTHPHYTSGDAVRPDAADTFFAPVHIQRLIKAWGPALFDSRLRTAIEEFERTSRTWYRKSFLIGPAALASALGELADGRIDPSSSLIARPNG